MYCAPARAASSARPPRTDELCRAIRAAVRGGRYVSPELAEVLVSGMQGANRHRAAAYRTLGARIPDLLQARRRPKRYRDRPGALPQREDREHLPHADPGKDGHEEQRRHDLLRDQERARAMKPMAPQETAALRATLGGGAAHPAHRGFGSAEPAPGRSALRSRQHLGGRTGGDPIRGDFTSEGGTHLTCWWSISSSPRATVSPWYAMRGSSIHPRLSRSSSCSPTTHLTSCASTVSPPGADYLPRQDARHCAAEGTRRERPLQVVTAPPGALSARLFS